MNGVKPYKIYPLEISVGLILKPENIRLFFSSSSDKIKLT